MMWMIAGNVKAARDVQSIVPGVQWNDTDGNEIKAHAAGLITVNETTYWYGSDNYTNGAFGNKLINVYTSKDLYNWENHGPAFTFDCSEVDTKKCYGDRVKVLYNAKTARYVMWMKSTPYVAVASSSSPLGPFRFEGRWRPNGEPHMGDPAAFQDPVSGDAYWIYSSRPDLTKPARVIRISKMTDDFLNLTGITNTIWEEREAPAVFYNAARKKYHIWTSHVTGWNPNAADVFVADSLSGKFVSEGNPCNSTQALYRKTFDSQSTYILPYTTKSGKQRFIFVADRWKPYVNNGTGRYIWLPIDISSNGTLNVTWRDSWTLEELEGASGAEAVDDFVV